jgi:hypothetical protein
MDEQHGLHHYISRPALDWGVDGRALSVAADVRFGTVDFW